VKLPGRRSPGAILSAALLALGSIAAAQDPGPPDWSGSTLECPATVRERDTMTCTLTVRRGAVDQFSEDPGADWTSTLPPKALLAEASSGVTFDAKERTLRGQVMAPPGGPSRSVSRSSWDPTRTEPSSRSGSP